MLCRNIECEISITKKSCFTMMKQDFLVITSL